MFAAENVYMRAAFIVYTREIGKLLKLNNYHLIMSEQNEIEYRSAKEIRHL